MADWSGCITKRGQHVFPFLQHWMDSGTTWEFDCLNGCGAVRIVSIEGGKAVKEEIRQKETADVER